MSNASPSYKPWSLPGPLALPLPRPGSPDASRLYRAALAIIGCASAADRLRLGQRLRAQLAPISPGIALGAWVSVSGGRPGDIDAAEAWLRAVVTLAWPDP